MNPLVIKYPTLFLILPAVRLLGSFGGPIVRRFHPGNIIQYLRHIKARPQTAWVHGFAHKQRQMKGPAWTDS